MNPTHHTETPPESSISEEGSTSGGEQVQGSFPIWESIASPESVSRLCFTTAMNSELEHRWLSQRLKVAESPYNYILNLPSKGIRGAFIESLNVWFEAPESKVTVIKEVIDLLHHSSLIIDDFQDNSPLRRGKPATHTVFGPAQAINSATYIIVKAVDRLQLITNSESLNGVMGTIMTIFQGQAMDVSWTFNNNLPSIQDYLLMVNDKTGALFRLAHQLLALSSQKCLSEDLLESLSSMVSLFGQYFQIRDDYMNLIDLEVWIPENRFVEPGAPANPLLGQNLRARDFVKLSRDILAKARSLFPDQPFRLMTDWGEVLILPPEFADEIRNDPRLSFSKAAMQDNHAEIPGFETVRLVGREDQLIQKVARKQLTKHLSAVIEPLAHESTLAVSLNFGDKVSRTEWQQMRLKPAILDIIARISSRIYLGDQLCRNEAWLKITKTYTTNFYTASTNLRMFPRSIRFLAHWFLPECRKLRNERKAAIGIITPLLERRREIRKAAVAAGKPIPVFNDALDWSEQEAEAAGSSFDPVIFQLTLSLLAIHTTYDLLQQTMIDLGRHPHYIEPLRQEVVQLLAVEGWKKTTLFKMKLLDSAIKESQLTMRRYVTEDMTLSNGLELKRGTRLNVDNRRLEDPKIYENPEVYNPYRFYDMRSDAGKDHGAQLVSTGSNHLGFGHGQHSCPGRFFAANEIKVALCHILVKYDWKLCPNTETKPDTRGMVAKSSPATDILIRRRSSVELDLNAI
ncbi:gibberellin cluster-C20-oxidase [Fusarium austroafricanum]|uniref:Gibberellin cluster-C20-oxidase n=1 Tax=Fusarium austroafricanum TaxID=2364996 RepID=A0A8H4JI33_9HYPO|nr:gibberellin cluster-C20-oxidase [Fusarium austroafricanum]